MGPTERRVRGDSARAQVLAIVRARATPRFGVTADALADRILQLPSIAGSGAADVRDGVERLVLDDLCLAMACATGEDAAWREVERSHFAFIRDFAARFLRGAEAEDLASTVIADLWQRGKIAQFQGRSTLRSWLGAVVTRAALNAKGSARIRMAADAPADSRLHTETPATAGHDDDGRALARLVRTALARLDAEAKVLLLFHYEQGLSLDAMAPLLGASKATLSRRLKAIRDQLRANVEAMAAAEHGPRAAQSLAGGIDRAQAEFDLSALLGGSEVKGDAGGRV